MLAGVVSCWCTVTLLDCTCRDFSTACGDRAMPITSSRIPEEGLLGAFFSSLLSFTLVVLLFHFSLYNFSPKKRKTAQESPETAVISVFSQDFKVEFSNPRQLSNLTHFICSTGADG